MSIYLDYNASAPVSEEVVQAMNDVYYNHPGNPDSRTHQNGIDAMKIVEAGREQIAQLLSVPSSSVIFTSGATESNNLAILGLLKYAFETNKKHIISSSIEHKSILNILEFLKEEFGFEVDLVNPRPGGRVSADEVLSKIRPDTLLISIMHVNNETGIIQPVDQIANMLLDKSVFFHIDATQSFGKINLKNINYDLLSLSSHKIGGPQGIGALILKNKVPISPITFGGGQERGLRPGTVPVALVAGFSKACEYIKEFNSENYKLKEEILTILKESGVEFEINGDPEYSTPNSLSIFFRNVSSEALMILLKDRVSISNGSACNVKYYEPSAVIQAMYNDKKRAENTIRISWGEKTNINELKKGISEILSVVKQLE